MVYKKYPEIMGCSRNIHRQLVKCLLIGSIILSVIVIKKSLNIATTTLLAPPEIWSPLRVCCKDRCRSIDSDNITQRIAVEETQARPHKLYYPGILLVIVYNRPHYKSLPLLEIMYRNTFPTRVYCGQIRPPNQQERENIPISFITFSHDDFEINYGYGFGIITQMCVLRAMEMYPNMTGYLHISDDVALHAWNLHNLPLNKAWYVPYHETQSAAHSPDDRYYAVVGDLNLDTEFHPKMLKNETGNLLDWGHYLLNKVSTRKSLHEIHHAMDNQKQCSTEYCRSMDQCSKNLKELYGKTSMFLRGQADFYYIPGGEKGRMFYDISKVFIKNKVFMEISLPTTIYCLFYPNNLMTVHGQHYVGWNDNGYKKKRNLGYIDKIERCPECIFMHPAKLVMKMTSYENLNNYICYYLEHTAQRLLPQA